VDTGTIPSIAVNDSFTWAFWVYLNAGNAATDVILGNRTNGPSSPLQFIKFTPNNFEYYIGSANGTMSYSVPTLEWRHLAVVKNGASLTYYSNGTSVNTSVTTADMASLPFYIGGDTGGEKISGFIDDVRIYNRALSASEIAALGAGNQPQTGISTHTLNAALDVNGDLLINSGHLVAGSNNITVEGDWQNNGGTFDAGTALVTLDGTTTGQLLLPGGQSFNNLSIGLGGGSWILASSLSVGGNFTLSQETFTLTGRNLSITGSVSNNGNIQLQGDETVTLTSGNDVDSGTWTYVGIPDGATQQFTIADFGSTTDYFHIVIDPPDGSSDTFIVGGSSLVMNGNMTISSGTFDAAVNHKEVFVAGDLIMDNYEVRWGTALWTVGGNFDNEDVQVILLNEGSVRAQYSKLALNGNGVSWTPKLGAPLLGVVTINGSVTYNASGGAGIRRVLEVFGTLSVPNGNTLSLIINGSGSEGTLLKAGGAITGSGEMFVQNMGIPEFGVGAVLDVSSLTVQSGASQPPVTGRGGISVEFCEDGYW